MTAPSSHPCDDPLSQLTCRRIVLDLLVRYLERSTDDATTAAVDAHIRDCPPCIDFVAGYEATRQAVRALRYEDVPPQLTDKLRDLVRREAAAARPPSD